MRDTFDYYRPETQEWEQVASSSWVWRWKVIYKDNTVFYQCNEDNGRFHQMREIDFSKAKEFIVYSPHFTQQYSMPIYQGSVTTVKPIFFSKRGLINVEVGQDEAGNMLTSPYNYSFYIVGFEYTYPSDKLINKNIKIKHQTTLDEKGSAWFIPEADQVVKAKYEQLYDPWSRLATRLAEQHVKGGK